MKTLYQIENSKSGRRVIYKGFNKIKWSPGDGEDGTFFEEEQMDFIIDLVEKVVGGCIDEIDIVRYEIRKFGCEWPIPQKSETKHTVLPGAIWGDEQNF